MGLKNSQANLWKKNQSGAKNRMQMQLLAEKKAKNLLMADCWEPKKQGEKVAVSAFAIPKLSQHTLCSGPFQIWNTSYLCSDESFPSLLLHLCSQYWTPVHLRLYFSRETLLVEGAVEHRNQGFQIKDNLKCSLSTPFICIRCSKLISSPAVDFHSETSLLICVLSSCLNYLPAFSPLQVQ